MPKDPNKINIKDKVKKVVPDNEWLRNVTKSFGFASLEVVKELLPNTSDMISWNSNVVDINSMISDIRENNGVRKMFSRQIKNLPHIKMAQEMKSNAMQDLKSGNLYNKNRGLGMTDDGEFDFNDFSFDTGGVEFVDDDGDFSDSIEFTDDDSSNITPTTVINTMPLAKAIQSSAEATVSAVSAVADQHLAIESEKMMMDKQIFNATLNAMSSINENLALLVQFNSDSTARYHAAAIEYFDKVTADKNQEEEEEKKKLYNPFTAGGGLKLDEYIEIIKKNLVDIKDSNIALSGMYDFLTMPELLEGFVKNPLGFLMEEGIKKGLNILFKSQLKPALGKLDKNVNSMLPAVLARINMFEESDDPVLQGLNKVFGYKHKKDEGEIDLGKYEKGSVSWDGISRKTLVDVIPTYLRRIESAITGSAERVFNYNTGKFTNREDIAEYYDKEKANAEVSGFYNVRSAVNDVLYDLDLSSDAKEQVMADFEDYYRKMVDKGYVISHKLKTDSMGFEVDELKRNGIGEYDDDRINLLRRVIDELPKHIQVEMGSTAITDSREKLYKFNEENRENPNLYGYSLLNDNSDKIGKVRYNVNNIPGLGNPKDRFGLGQLDYLRDIRSALIHGIRVFPEDMRGRGLPNGKLLAKERNEEDEYDRTVREEEEAKQREAELKNSFKKEGRSVADAANMHSSDWKQVFPKEKGESDSKVINAIDKINDNVEDWIYKILFGPDNYKEIAIEKLKNMYGRSKPIMKSMQDFYGDTIKAFKCFFTGQGYTTSDGIVVKGEDSLLGSIKTSILGIKDKFKEATSSNKGMFTRFFDDFMDGFSEFKTSLFGEKGLSEGKETFQNLMAKIKQRLPKALGIGLGTGLVKTVFASNLGVLGNFLLPGGPIGAILTGTAFSLLKQSETFNRVMFGEKDEDGNRLGGLISRTWQEKYQEYKGAIVKGAGIGILGSLFLPGGPVAGAILGVGAGIASKNEAFLEALYGKDFREHNKRSLANGLFGKVFKRLAHSDSEIENPKLAKFLGATGVGIGLAQGVGLLPSFLLPGGPIVGSLLGLAAGITASSNKFQEWLLGEKDIDGQRFGGLMQRFANWIDLSFARPLKIKLTGITDVIYGALRKNLFDPLARSVEPILHGVKNVFINAKDSLIESFSKITNPIVQAFKDIIIRPMAKLIKGVLSPIKWIMKKTFSFLGKSLVGLTTLPFQLIGAVGHKADKYNEKSVIRQESMRRRREYDRNTPKEERNYWDRKRAGKVSDEEAEELINEKLKYRDGKTWKERKKEQKEDYKDEMLRRKERRKDMERQFKEDKKFAKENKYKYSSKKQKEKRDQDLKEKEQWVNEQKLLQAQETDEKVKNIKDNVINLADYQKNNGGKLDDIKNTVKEGFNKLAEKFTKGLPAPKQDEPEEDHMTKIYDFLDEKNKRRGNSEGNTVEGSINNVNENFTKGLPAPKQDEPEEDHMTKIYDFLDEKNKRNGAKPSDMIIPPNPQEYGKITDEDLKPIYDFLDKENEKDEKPSTLKGALDDLKGTFKSIFKGVKYENIDTEADKKEEKPNNVIDMEAMRKKLRDDDQSHAKGLDKVPEDGYVAELHKDEMVVPKKPAGKLRRLMKKAGHRSFEGLYSILSEISEDDRRDRRDNPFGLTEEEEDRRDELEDRKRRDKIVNKKPGLLKNAGNFIGNIFNETSEMDDEYRDRDESRHGLIDNAIELGIAHPTMWGLKGLAGGLGFLNSGLGAIGNIFGLNGASKTDQEDDALGLSDQQEDMMKEMEDRERKEKVSRKNVDFIQDKINADAKEKSDRKWKESLLTAVRHIGNFAGAAATGTTSLFDLIGKGVDTLGSIFDGGFSWLKSLGLPALITGLGWLGNQYQESEEYIVGHTDKDGNRIADNYDLVNFRTWVSARDQLIHKPLRTIKNKFVDPLVNGGKKVYEGGKNVYNKVFNKKTADAAVDSTDNVIDFASRKATKEGAEAATEAGGKKVFKEGMEKGVKSTGKVIDIKDAKIMKNATKSADGKILTKAVDAADDSGLVGKLVKLGKQAVEWIGEQVAKKFPKVAKLGTKLLGMADEIFAALLKSADNIVAKFAPKITNTFTRIGSGASTLGVTDVALGVLDLGTGFTAGNAGNLFGVSPENVDFTMRTISSVLQTLTNWNFLAIISLINEITNMIFNVNFLRSIAIFIYNIIGGDQNLNSRITAKEIDSCTSIEQALEIMGVPQTQYYMLKDSKGNWKNFAEVDNEELGGIISPTEQMELARLQYNLENGTKVSSQAFIDQESKTVGTKFMDWITPDTANEKKAKYENKADEHRKKAEESDSWLGKTYHNWRAERNEKKAKKTEEKAKKKKAKAEEKADYHKKKAEESDSWLGKTYHNWRAKKNEKKAKKYTIEEDKVVGVEEPTTETVSDQQAMEAKANITPAEQVKAMYPNMEKGDVIEDAYGNKYDHTGKCIYSPSMDMEGDAGAGDGEAVMVDEYGNQYDANGNLISPKTGKEGKAETAVNKKKNKKQGKISKWWDKTKERGSKVLNTGKTFLSNAGKGMKEFAENPVAFMLNTGADVVNTTYETGKKVFKGAKDKAIEIKDKVVDGIKNNKTVKKVTDYAKEKYNKAKDAVTAGIEEGDSAGTKAGKIVRNVITIVNDQMKKIVENIKKGITDTVKGVGDLFKKGIEGIKKGFKTLITETPKKIGEIKDKIINGFKDGISAITKGFKNSVKKLKDGISTKVDDMKETFSKENIKKKLTEKTDEVKKAWGKFTDSFGKIFDDFKKKFEDWKEKFSNFKMPSLKFSDIKIGWKKVVGFFKDFVAALIAKDPDKLDDGDEGSPNTKPLDQQLKPKNYFFSPNDNKYDEKDAGRTVGGLKDRGNTHNFPFYAQGDNRWGNEKLIGGKSMGESGCGPTATAMVLTHLTGQHITPDTLAKAGEEYLPGYTSYSYYPHIANKFKLNYSEIQSNDIQTLRATLAKGQPVMLSGKDLTNSNYSPYTDTGHIVVATGIDGNNIQINDPRGPAYSGSYSINNVMKGLRRGFVLSSTKDTQKVGLPTSGIYSSEHTMNGEFIPNDDLPVSEGITENLGGDAGQIKLWEKVVGYAKAFKEKLQYVYGSKAIDKNGMTTDCSGFTKHVMDRCGVKISAGSANQKNDGVGVDKSQAQAGDLVVWKGHVGLVVDSNKNMIDAGSGSVPKIRSYETDYWRSRGDYVIRRVLSDPNQMVSAKVDNAHTGIGFNGIVGSQGGQDLSGGSSSGTTSGSSEPEVNQLGIFGELEKIGNNYLASIFNGKVVDMYANNESSDGTTTGSSSVDISGISDTATAVWKFFTGNGYSKHATAGIMGNLQQESGLDPTKKQYGGGPGRGIAQWTVSEGRFKGLQSHAQSKGKDWTDLQSQLEWIDMELKGKDASTANILKKNYGGIDGFKNATDTRWAVEAFEKSFERAGKPNFTNRYKYAENFYTQLSNAGMGPAMATMVESAPSEGIPSSMNGWKYYQQSDSKWSGAVGNSTVSKGGCGPTSAAMMLSTIFGKEINPLTMTKWAHSNGTWNGAMQWTMPSKVASTFGLKMTELGAAQNGVDAKVLGYVKDAIKAGKPVMLTGKGKGASGSSASMDTPFTPGGHVVLAVGIDGSGNLIINDPRGAKRSKAYTDDGILNIGPGLRGAWAFDTSGGSIPSTITTDGDFAGGTTTGDGTTANVETVDQLGVFSKLQNLGNNFVSSIFNGKIMSNAGSGDGNTYLINPKDESDKLSGDAGKGDGKATYTKSVTSNVSNNTPDVNAQRSLDSMNRKINAAVNNMNTPDPVTYTEVLKLIMEELQSINKNTAATATGVNNIEIFSANTPVNTNDNHTTKDRYNSKKQYEMPSKLQTINQSSGYSTARQIAGYKK